VIPEIKRHKYLNINPKIDTKIRFIKIISTDYDEYAKSGLDLDFYIKKIHKSVNFNQKVSKTFEVKV
jgi:hypothetical protein